MNGRYSALMSVRSAAASTPDDRIAVRPFRMPAGDTSELAAVVDRNVWSIRCELASTSASRTSISADGDESRSSSLDTTASAATFSGASDTVEKSAFDTGIGLDSPTQ